MAIGPCILTKVCCAPFMGSSRWVIGWAMVGRAEFAYFIAIMAKSLKMVDDKLFAILIWSLIYATIFAPLIFRKVLLRFMENEDKAPPTLSTHASGHLPDFEAEELELEEQRTHAEYESTKAKLQQKEGEIIRLHSAQSVQGELSKLKAELAAKDQEIARLKGLTESQQPWSQDVGLSEDNSHTVIV